MNQQEKTKEARVAVNLPVMPWPAGQQNVNASLTPGQLPLTCTDSKREGGSYTEQFLSLAKGAGFNVIQSVINDFDRIKTSINRAQKYGMKFFIRFGNYAQDFKLPNDGNNPTQSELNKILPTNSVWSSTYSNWTTNIAELLDYSAQCIAAGDSDPLDTAVACQLCDEPAVCGFWGITELSQRLWNLYQEKRPGIKPFLMCNMFPDTTVGDNVANKSIHLNKLSGGMNNAASFITGYTPIASYSEFVELYKNMTNPAVLSFDSYPIKEKEGVRDGNAMAQFFGTLVQYRELKYSLGIDFWSTICSCKFVPGKLYNDIFFPDTREALIPTPTLAHLRFAAFTSILFGASGVSYWGVIDVKMSSVDNGKRFDCAISLDGSKTQTYEYIKALNEQIKRLSSIFLLNREFGVFVTKRPPYIMSDTELPGLKIHNPATAFGPLKSLTQNGAGFVLNLRFDDAYMYLLIVNMDPDNEQTVVMSFTINNTSYASITTGGGVGSFALWQELSPSDLSNGLTVKFAPGDIRVIKYRRI